MSKKRFCELIGIHPKSIYKGKKIKTFSSAKRKKRAEMGKEVLSGIKEVIEQRCTYGYKRVTALYNKKRVDSGLSRYNKKRIYRVMRDNGLLLPKSGILRREHKGTGKVMTLHSNTRWCSDCFEIHCFNGEKVYVSFVLDGHDREIISFVSSGRPLLSEDIQSLMIMAVERRFSGGRAFREVEFLSDRGVFTGLIMCRF